MPRKNSALPRECRPVHGGTIHATLVLVSRGHADLTTSQRVIYNTLSRRD